MVFQAHLVLLIKERGFAKAAQIAWDIADRLRKEGHEAYVASIDRPGSRAKRQRLRGTPGKTKTEPASS